MTEILSKYGFKYSGSCNCNGVFTQKYKKGDYLVRVRKNRYKFMIQKGGKSTTIWLPTAELENKLNEILESDKKPVKA